MGAGADSGTSVPVQRNGTIDMKVTQIVVQQYRARDGRFGSNILGLGEDGKVYKWRMKQTDWKLYDDSDFRKPKQEEKDEEFF